MAQNLIMGIATGTAYLLAALPFVTSARFFHPHDRIVLLCDFNLPLQIYEDMQRLGVELYPVATETHDVDFHMQSRRYREYFTFLVGQTFDRIFLADTRDLLFQNNIFAGFSHQNDLAIFFEESKQHTIATQEWNRQWIQQSYGDQVLQEMGDYPVICSGTTLGTQNAILTYLAYMIAFIEKSHVTKNVGGTDQGHHNYIIRKKYLPFPFLILPQQNTLVYTYQPSDSFHLAEDATVITSSGIQSAVVHQYDRMEINDAEALSLVLIKLKRISDTLGVLSEWWEWESHLLKTKVRRKFGRT